MSLETAKEFLKKANADQGLMAKLTAVEGNGPAAVKLGAEQGFVFTIADLNAAMDEVFGDLSDDDLAGAAGGQGGMRPLIPFGTGTGG